MSIKLYYFDGRGLAEPTRLILAYAGVEFEDIRAPLDLPVTIPPEIKAKCTWGQVPLVELEDGKKLAQSLAITRYFAKKHSLVPEDIYEAALCDEYVDSIREFLQAWYLVTHEKDPEKRQEKRAEVLKSTKQRFFDVFESIVAKSSEGKHLVGNALTWADIYLTHGLNNIELVHEINLLNDYPALKKLSENVLQQKGIQAWIQRRPVTKF
ncbi:Glutathione S-transferase [Orchesella cincta]|uniref:glutathione transferase n=1 Tax=Orchesella cincta TaxID=48709 RepID=A0A1D2MTQ1_ORCCI|nr:Glutathione S-transferase [Orchesella cincta]